MILRFELHRKVDTTGVSGTGRVAEGVRFSHGLCVLRWLTGIGSTTCYTSMEDVRKIHCHGGNTKVEWVDDCFWGSRDLGQEGRDESLSPLRAEPFNRGKFDCMMDGNENVPFGSIGGLEKRDDFQKPHYIADEDWKAYAEGYREQAWAQYGEDWRTCAFGWKPVLSISKDGIKAVKENE